ncbi:pentapeptide repeat-containing protein [Capilliphycus salinus ALCB114379]|uniref:pentapeptide repeat-containing protein n=1 Tax=Capilliphycus salinus TaxID=2768948 RepID=UPI0039A4DC55
MAQELVKIYNLVKKYKEGERNFTGINLNEANLSRINLSQANLSDASLCVTNLSGADLSGINLSRANLNVGRLSQANLSGANLSRATLNVANLVRADLSDAILVETLAIRSELIRSRLNNANLTKANLNGADLREARVGQANFCQANLNGANLRGVSGASANFESADLRRANLVKANLPKADFSHAEMRQTNLTYADLRQANLNGANLRWADLRGANLSGADLSGANLSGANLSGANLHRATLAKASLVHVDLTQANLIKADWMGADISGATLTGAKLYEVLRFNLKAEDVTCEWVDLSPNGDHSEVYQFTPETLKKFFNQVLPTVQVIVDAPLDLEANLVLAETYHHIAQEYPLLKYPPSIDTDIRRTVITFRIDREEYLFSMGCLAIFPFDDASKTQKNIVNLVRNLQERSEKNKNQLRVLAAMGEVISKAQDLKQVVRSIRSEQMPEFFHRPTQTILTNTSQKKLTVHTHSDFGKRFKPSLVDRERDNHYSKFVEPLLFDPEQVIDFVDSFDYLS